MNHIGFNKGLNVVRDPGGSEVQILSPRPTILVPSFQTLARIPILRFEQANARGTDPAF
jgi:hypothetical protein